MEDRRERDPREEDRRIPIRFKFNSYGKTSDHLHDKEVDRLYAIFGWQQRKLGNTVSIYRDEMHIRRVLQRDLHWTRWARRNQTGNMRYKLSLDERTEVAHRHGLQVVDGHILMPDREVLVRTPEGRESVVSLEALTRTYSTKQIQRHIKSGAVTSMAHSKPAWKVCAERMGWKRVKDGPDMISRLMRAAK